VSPQSTAKWAKWHRDAYAVGALARFNLNASFLRPLAKKTAAMFGMQPGICNPYFNSVAQIVEVVQVVEHSLELIDGLLTAGIKPEPIVAKPKAGEGVGAVEAPRGILFHRYAFDDKGNCLKANLCIPTNQNHANIQKDFEAFVRKSWTGRRKKSAFLECCACLRSCISCSTHCLNVEFV